MILTVLFVLVFGALLFRPDSFGVLGLGLLALLCCVLAVSLGLEIAAQRREIRERKRVEAALRAGEDRLRQVIDLVPHLIYAKDREGRFLLANRTAAEAYGTTVEALLGRGEQELHQVAAEVLGRGSADREVLETGKPNFAPEEEFTDRSGQRRVLQTTRIPFDATGSGEPGLLAVAIDITRRKNAEEEQLVLQYQVQQAQKLESLGVLAGGIAHDFNNLLMGILGNASMALLELPPGAAARRSVTDIETAGRRAADLTKQLLAYSGKGKFMVERFTLQALIDEMTHLLEASISKNVILRMQFDHPAPVQGDITQIRQVIMNLIMNASEAIDGRSGIVRILTGLVDVDRARLDRAAHDRELVEGIYAFVEVADTGHGMDDETQARIFDPFFTTKFTGRGLGLAAVIGIVHGHHGLIEVESRPGRGSTLRVLLPTANELIDAPFAAAEDEGLQAWRGSGTVLVVDDEDTARTVARRMLERMGFEVVTAADGREALALYRERADEIDAVLLDLTMPHMNGEETFRAMREVRSDVRVLLTSGYHEQEVATRFDGTGLAGFVQKPFTIDMLAGKLREALQARPLARTAAQGPEAGRTAAQAAAAARSASTR